MDGTGEHYAKWNKPVSEGQIPYDLTFNWNITKEKSKQNITRDIEIKNNLTVTRGEGGWDNEGKVFSGTTIKDTWRQGREVGLTGVRGIGGGEMQRTVTEQQ